MRCRCRDHVIRQHAGRRDDRPLGAPTQGWPPHVSLCICTTCTLPTQHTIISSRSLSLVSSRAMPSSTRRIARRLRRTFGRRCACVGFRTGQVEHAAASHGSAGRSQVDDVFVPRSFPGQKRRTTRCRRRTHVVPRRRAALGSVGCGRRRVDGVRLVRGTRADPPARPRPRTTSCVVVSWASIVEEMGPRCSRVVCRMSCVVCRVLSVLGRAFPFLPALVLLAPSAAWPWLPALCAQTGRRRRASPAPALPSTS